MNRAESCRKNWACSLKPCLKEKPLKQQLILLMVALSMATTNVFGKDGLGIKFPQTLPPAGSQWVWVGKQMMVDGIPMSMKTFSFSGQEQQLVSHFENDWKTQGHGTYSRKILGPKRFLTYVTQDFITTVEYMMHAGGYSGTIAVSSPKRFRTKIHPSILKPPSARVVSNIESLDEGVYSQSVTFLSRKGHAYNVEYYKSQMRAQGWLQVSGRCEPSGCNLHLQSSVGQLQISIKDLPGDNGKGSRILFHLIKQ